LIFVALDTPPRNTTSTAPPDSVVPLAEPYMNASPLEIVAPVTVPPARTTSVPPRICVAIAMPPPIATSSPPPLTIAPLAVPADKTTSMPPLLTIVPLAAP
jgi:hypothetical protein